MKLGKFSILSLLVLLALVGMSIRIYIQNMTLSAVTLENSRLRDELGKIDPEDSSKVYVRPLASRAFNSWGFKINKPVGKFRYGFGIADIDEAGKVKMPGDGARYFQHIDSDAAGEVDVVLSLWRNERSKWYIKFQEFQGGATKEATATRIDGFPGDSLAPIWRFSQFTVQNGISEMVTDDKANGDPIAYDPNELILLFRSESPQQTPEARKAFVVFLAAKKDGLPSN